MLKTRASDPETMTSCSESLDTETYRVSPGLASEGLKVIRFTVLSAFIAPSIFSLCEGSRLGGTAIVYIVFLNFINVVIYTMSADAYPTETTEKTPLNPGGGGDDNTDEWVDVDLSQQPIPEKEREEWWFPSDTDPPDTGASATPSGSENIQMTTRLPTENQGASGGTAETSFNQTEPITLENRALKEIEDDFPNADWTQVNVQDKTIKDQKGRPLRTTVVVNYHTKNKWYPLFTKSPGEAEKTLNTASLPKEILKALGPYKPESQKLDDAIAETNKALQNVQNQETAQLKALNQAQTKADEAQRLRKEMDAIRDRTKDTEAKTQQLKDTNGPLDRDAIQKLKEEKRKLATDHQEKRKQLDALVKTVQQARQLQQDINKIRLSKGETERRLGRLKAQKDDMLPDDKLKQRAAELNEHITEDINIIEGDNSPEAVAAARTRLAVRNEELEIVNEKLEERQR